MTEEKITGEQELILKVYIKVLREEGKTTVKYEMSIRHLFSYINKTGKDLLQLQVSEVSDFREYLFTRKKTKRSGTSHYTESSVSGFLYLLSSFYKYLQRENMIAHNPFSEARKLDKKYGTYYITEQQDQVLNEYLRELKIQDKNTNKIKTSARVFFTFVNDTALDYLRLKVSEAQEFQTYLTTMTKEDGAIHYNISTVSAMLSLLTSFYEYLRKKRIVQTNPFLEIKKVTKNRILPRNVLNEKNMDKFLKHLRHRWKEGDLNERKKIYKVHVISELMYSTGARINEIAKLKVEDVDLLRGVVRIEDSKTRQIREGILNSYAEKVLKVYIEEMREHVLLDKSSNMEYLFGSKRHIKQWVNEILQDESEKLGLGEFTSHNFRHAVGYHLLRNGCDMRHIQGILGHKRLSSTQIYTKVDRERLKGVLDEFHPRILRAKKDEREDNEEF
ncbi:MAG: tyrosine-type recombinase/integrase [bacterium]|nr:tyrosine-type recombinase/integrase [bacterium]